MVRCASRNSFSIKKPRPPPTLTDAALAKVDRDDLERRRDFARLDQIYEDWQASKKKLSSAPPDLHMPPHQLHAQSHSRQDSQHHPPVGPSFSSIPFHPSQPCPQYAQHAQPPNIPHFEDERHNDQSEEIMVPFKKPRKKKVKKERDPNAPRRPASAYILFQNAVRTEMRAVNPTVNYRELTRQIGDRWKNLSEDDKRPWSEAGKQAMSSWNIQNREYKTLHPVPQATSPNHAILTSSSTAPAQPKRPKPVPPAPLFDAEGNVIKRKRGRPRKVEKVEEDMLIQHQQQQLHHHQHHQQPHLHLQQQQQQQQDPNALLHHNAGHWPDAVGYSMSHSAYNGAQSHSNGAEPGGGYSATGHQQHHSHWAHQTSAAGGGDGHGH